MCKHGLFRKIFKIESLVFHGFLSLIKVPFAAAHPYQLRIQVTPPPPPPPGTRRARTEGMHVEDIDTRRKLDI